jgi:ABC-type branched-subunit amino acid transport system substrate-binding protein
MHKPLSRRQALGAMGAAAGAASWPALAQTTPVASPGPLVIGQSAHLSGPLAPTFAPVLDGQKLALAEYNARVGATGRKVELLTLDDAYDPKKCVDNVTRLIDEHKATALFGLASTANVAAVLPLLAEKKVPLVGVYTGAPLLRAKHHPYFFTNMASYRDEIVHMLRNQKTLLRDRVSLVYMNNPLGQPMVPVVEEVAREEGLNLVAKAPLEASGANVAAAVQAGMAGNPQALVLVAFGPVIVPFVKAWKAAGGAPIYAISIANSQALVQAMGDDARGLAFTQLIPSLGSQMPLVRDFNAAAARHKVPAERGQLFGYLPMRVLLDGIRRAGRSVDSASLVVALEKMTRTDVGGFRIHYGPQNHHGSSYVDITIVGPGGRYIA